MGRQREGEYSIAVNGHDARLLARGTPHPATERLLTSPLSPSLQDVWLLFLSPRSPSSHMSVYPGPAPAVQENPGQSISSARSLHEHREFESQQFSPLLRLSISFQTHVQEPQIPRITRLIVGCRAGCHCFIGCQPPAPTSGTGPLHLTHIAEGSPTIVFSYDAPRHPRVDGAVIILRKSLPPRSDSTASASDTKTGQDADDPTVDSQEHVISCLISPEFLPQIEQIGWRGWQRDERRVGSTLSV